MITNTAAALSEEHIRQLRGLFPQATLFSMYGLTECKRVTYLPPDQLDIRPTSVGRGMPNEEVWLVDDQGKRLPNGSTGELVIRGSNVMRGYWEKPDETAKRLKPGPNPGEMVLYSGDIFRTDEEGFLYFVRAQGRHHQEPRRESEPARGGERALRHAWRARSRGGRRSRRRAGTGDQGLRGAQERLLLQRKGSHQALCGEARELHGAQVRRVRRRACPRPTPARSRRPDWRKTREARTETRPKAWRTSRRKSSNTSWTIS